MAHQTLYSAALPSVPLPQDVIFQQPVHYTEGYWAYTVRLMRADLTPGYLEWTTDNHIRLGSDFGAAPEFDVALADIKTVRQTGTVLYFSLKTGVMYTVDFDAPLNRDIATGDFTPNTSRHHVPILSRFFGATYLQQISATAKSEVYNNMPWWLDNLRKRGVRVGITLTSNQQKTWIIALYIGFGVMVGGMLLLMLLIVLVTLRKY